MNRKQTRAWPAVLLTAILLIASLANAAENVIGGLSVSSKYRLVSTGGTPGSKEYDCLFAFTLFGQWPRELSAGDVFELTLVGKEVMGRRDPNNMLGYAKLSIMTEGPMLVVDQIIPEIVGSETSSQDGLPLAKEPVCFVGHWAYADEGGRSERTVQESRLRCRFKVKPVPGSGQYPSNLQIGLGVFSWQEADYQLPFVRYEYEPRKTSKGMVWALKNGFPRFNSENKSLRFTRDEDRPYNLEHVTQSIQVTLSEGRPPDWGEEHAEAPYKPPAPDATVVTPEKIRQLADCFATITMQKIHNGYYVKNDDWLVALKHMIQDRTRWAENKKAGRCGDYGEWGMEWIRPCLDQLFGKKALVTDLVMQEWTSTQGNTWKDPQTYNPDRLFEANHRATRVVLPNGERYMVDFWSAVSTGHAELLTEQEWINRWRARIGVADYVVNRTEEEMLLKSLIKQFGEAKGVVRFQELARNPKYGIKDPDLWIRSWQQFSW
jgi:hypothetical protein